MTEGDDRLALFGGPPVRPVGPFPRQPNRPEIQDALEKAYRDGDWHRYHSRNTQSLRDALAAMHGVSHVELCASGTVGLEIALKGVNIKAGDEVIVAGYDFKGVPAAVLAVGAVPVVVDVDLETLAPSVDHLAEAANDRTKGMIVSHLHGGMAPMQAIIEWARPRRIAVVEDACQSPGATIDGKRAGTWGDVGVFSFGGSKLLTAGRGGGLLASDPRVAQRIRTYCERGNHAYPLSELQAAVLLPQVESLDQENRRRLEAVRWLASRIDPAWGITVTTNARPTVEPAYYKLGLLLSGGHWAAVPRATVAAAFRAEGVAIDEGFHAVTGLFARSRYRASGTLTNAGYAAGRVLVLHHPVLIGDADELGLVLRAMGKVSAAAIRGALGGSELVVPSP